MSTEPSAQQEPRPESSAKSITEALRERIRNHYIRPPVARRGGHLDSAALLPGAVVLTEVPAPGGGRRIDVLAIGLTSARHGLDGFEIKATRSDWLRELDSPRKADGWFRHTHRWWVCAPSPAIVRTEELPEGWGLMIPDPRSPRRLKPIVKATTRTPDLDWPVVWEISKKMDRIRAEKTRVAADAVRTQLRAEYQATIHTAAARLVGPDSPESTIGAALLQACEVEPWRLQMILDRNSWVRDTIAAVVTAAAEDSGYRDLPRELQRLIGDAQRLAAEHQRSAQALLDAASALTVAPCRTPEPLHSAAK